MGRPKSDDPVVNKPLGLPTSLWVEVEKAAKRHRSSRSGWIASVLADAIGNPRRPGAKTPAAKNDSTCTHPVGRRLGDYCAICGERVRGKP